MVKKMKRHFSNQKSNFNLFVFQPWEEERHRLA